MDSRFGLSLLLAVIVAVVVGLVAAQTQSKIAAAPVPTPRPTIIPTPGPGEVEILDRGGNGLFAPSSIFVASGGTVTWVNNDTVDHTVAADDGSFTSPVLAPHQTYTHTFKKIGTFPYSDYLHPELHGAIEVVK